MLPHGNVCECLGYFRCLCVIHIYTSMDGEFLCTKPQKYARTNPFCSLSAITCGCVNVAHFICKNNSNVHFAFTLPFVLLFSLLVIISVAFFSFPFCLMPWNTTESSLCNVFSTGLVFYVKRVS